MSQKKIEIRPDNTLYVFLRKKYFLILDKKKYKIEELELYKIFRNLYISYFFIQSFIFLAGNVSLIILILKTNNHFNFFITNILPILLFGCMVLSFLKTFVVFKNVELEDKAIEQQLSDSDFYENRFLKSNTSCFDFFTKSHNNNETTVKKFLDSGLQPLNNATNLMNLGQISNDFTIGNLNVNYQNFISKVENFNKQKLFNSEEIIKIKNAAENIYLFIKNDLDIKNLNHKTKITEALGLLEKQCNKMKIYDQKSSSEINSILGYINNFFYRKFYFQEKVSSANLTNVKSNLEYLHNYFNQDSSFRYLFYQEKADLIDLMQKSDLLYRSFQKIFEKPLVKPYINQDDEELLNRWVLSSSFISRNSPDIEDIKKDIDNLKKSLNNNAFIAKTFFDKVNPRINEYFQYDSVFEFLGLGLSFSKTKSND
jgi:hypothetical protein